MLLSTTSTLEGKEIIEYRGIVFGEAISDYAFKGKTGAEKKLINNRADAINEMISHAENIGANAIVGINVKYEAISFTLITVASGTAVVVR